MTTAALRALRRAALGLCTLCILGASAPALAQSDACLAALVRAEARYVEGTLDASGAGLDACLDGTDAAVPALRLIALAHLRLGQITDAKLALLRILALRPSYRPNSVQDPPTYVALATSVRRQLDAASGPAVAAALMARGPWERTPRRPTHLIGLPGPAPALREVGGRLPLDLDRPPPPRPAAVSAWGGVGSYGGERGVAATTAVGEFTENAGPLGGLDIEVALTPRLAVFGAVEAGRYPTLPTRKGPHPAFDEVGSFSAWLQFVTVGARARPLARGPVGPTLSLGGGLALGRRDGAVRPAGVVTGAVGLEGRLSTANRLFLEAYGALTMPGYAIDGAGHPPPPPDIFSGIRVGLRSRIR